MGLGVGTMLGWTVPGTPEYSQLLYVLEERLQGHHPFLQHSRPQAAQGGSVEQKAKIYVR